MSVATSESLRCDHLFTVPLPPCLVSSQRVWEWIGRGSVQYHGTLTVSCEKTPRCHESHGVEGTLIFYNKVFSAKKYMSVKSSPESNEFHIKVPSMIHESNGPGPHPFYFRVVLQGDETHAFAPAQVSPVISPPPAVSTPPVVADETTTTTVKNILPKSDKDDLLILQGRFGNTERFSPEMLLALETNTGAFQRFPVGTHALGWTTKPRYL